MFGRYTDETVQGTVPGIRLSRLSEALLDGIFKWKNEGYMRECAAEMAAELGHCSSNLEVDTIFGLNNAQVDNGKVASLDEFTRLRERLRNLGLQQHLETMSDSECALLLLTREHAHLNEHQKAMSREFGASAALLLYLFQGAAWSNVLVMSLYYTTESTTTLDWLMVVFASCPWFEQMHLWWLGFGTDSGTIVCLFISLFGVVAMLVDNSDLLPMGTARFMTGFSTVTIFTKNTRFTQLMTTVSTMGQLAWPLVGSLMAVTCFYALTAREIFQNALNETNSGFFTTYSRSLSTFFRLFVAEGWADVMYSATDATNTSARLFFMSYMLIATLLFAQLTISWVVTVFGLVQKIGSEKVYRFLLKFVAPGA